MNLFSIISNYFWLIALVFSFQYLRSSPSLKAKLSEDQSFANVHRSIRQRMFVMHAIPWLVMGAGSITGNVPTVWHYFRPRDQNPYVLAFFISVGFIWAISALWIFVWGGAKTAAEHNLINVRINRRRVELDETGIKLATSVMLAGGIIGTILMFSNRFPVPFE